MVIVRIFLNSISLSEYEYAAMRSLSKAFLQANHLL